MQCRWDSWTFESLIQKAYIEDKDKLTLRWYALDSENEFEYDEIINIQNHILRNVSDPIMNGDNYGQKDIIFKLKQMGL